MGSFSDPVPILPPLGGIVFGSFSDYFRLVFRSSSDRFQIVSGSFSDRCRIAFGSGSPKHLKKILTKDLKSPVQGSQNDPKPHLRKDRPESQATRGTIPKRSQIDPKKIPNPHETRPPTNGVVEARTRFVAGWLPATKRVPGRRRVSEDAFRGRPPFSLLFEGFFFFLWVCGRGGWPATKRVLGGRRFSEDAFRGRALFSFFFLGFFFLFLLLGRSKAAFRGRVVAGHETRPPTNGGVEASTRFVAGWLPATKRVPRQTAASKRGRVSWPGGGGLGPWPRNVSPVGGVSARTRFGAGLPFPVFFLVFWFFFCRSVDAVRFVAGCLPATKRVPQRRAAASKRGRDSWPGGGVKTGQSRYCQPDALSFVALSTTKILLPSCKWPETMSLHFVVQAIV